MPKKKLTKAQVKAQLTKIRAGYDKLLMDKLRSEGSLVPMTSKKMLEEIGKLNTMLLRVHNK